VDKNQQNLLFLAIKLELTEFINEVYRWPSFTNQ